MQKRWIIVPLIVAVLGAILYLGFKSPPGLEARGTTEETIAFYGMIAAVAGSVAALLGVIKEVLSLRKERIKK